ncbi:hypothetical protein FOXB_03780, partial [Fusarium oxysporum f. sp. conglutinans Fo5176]
LGKLYLPLKRFLRISIENIRKFFCIYYFSIRRF